MNPGTANHELVFGATRPFLPDLSSGIRKGRPLFIRYRRVVQVERADGR